MPPGPRAFRSPLFSFVFRLNPRYRLTPRSKLPPELKRKLRGLAEEGAAWGVLHSADGGPLPVKTVGEEAASLLNALRRPKPALEAPGSEPSSEYDAFLRKQLLDSVLEIRLGEDFAAGAAALERAAPSKLEGPAANALERLSHRAVIIGYQGPWEDPLQLSARLYFYNRVPMHERWRRLFPDPSAVAAALGLDAAAAKVADDFWRVWRLRSDAEAGLLTYKLYVSPTPEQLPEVFRLVRARAEDSGAHSMKTAFDARGLLRPDKLVLYFARQADALALGRSLLSELRGVAAHGVPFTCSVDGSALVSWGVDPPRGAQFFDWQKGESWRLAVANRLARAILAVRREQPRDPLASVLAAARASGIDPTEWKPLRGWEVLA